MLTNTLIFVMVSDILYKNRQNGISDSQLQSIKMKVSIEHRGVESFKEKSWDSQSMLKKGREIMTVIFRLHKIRSNINLVSYRLISCGTKLSSLRFSAERLKLLLKTARRLIACGRHGKIFHI